MLHITRSPEAAERLRAAALPGEVGVWSVEMRDRIDAEEDEIVLWFGAPAPEQQAMLDAVAACSADVPVSFICTEPNLAHAAPDRLTWLFHHRPTAGAAFYRLCATAHGALHAGPVAIERALPELNALPLVQDALRTATATRGA